MSRLYLRLLLWFCAANIITLVISVALTERLAREAYRADPDWVQLARQANDAYVHGGSSELRRWLERHRAVGIEATLFEGEHNLSGRRPMLPRLPPELLSGDAIEVRLPPDLRVISQRVTGADGVSRRFVAMRRPRPPPRIEQLLAMQIGLSLLVIGFVGWRLSRSIAVPIAAVAAAARRMAAGDLSARVAAPHNKARDEVGDLARDFDGMAARIETLVTQERSVLQDVSHELRSPLARLHLLLDLARRSQHDEAGRHFARAEHEIEHLNRLIGESLALSRIESDLPGAQRVPVGVARLVREALERARVEADSRGIELVESVPPANAESVEVDGDATLLARALDNLLGNALKFSHDAGRVQLDVRCAHGEVAISIRDWGPGVPESDLANLARPFFRGRNAERAEGHGLGLAIVARIAKAHGGRLQVTNGAGGGLEAMLLLPLRAQAAVA